MVGVRVRVRGRGRVRVRVRVRVRARVRVRVRVSAVPLEPAPWVLHVYPPFGLPERLLGAGPRASWVRSSEGQG